MNFSVTFRATTFEEFQRAYEWSKAQGANPVVSFVAPSLPPPPVPPAGMSRAIEPQGYGPKANEYFDLVESTTGTRPSKIRPTKEEHARFGYLPRMQKAEEIAASRLAAHELGIVPIEGGGGGEGDVGAPFDDDGKSEW